MEGWGQSGVGEPLEIVAQGCVLTGFRGIVPLA